MFLLWHVGASFIAIMSCNAAVIRNEPQETQCVSLFVLKERIVVKGVKTSKTWLTTRVVTYRFTGFR